MKKYLLTGLGVALLLAARPSFATPTTVMSISGKPWTSGASSFDWSSWSFADNILTNNNGSKRAWVVPLPWESNSTNTHVVTVYIANANGAGQPDPFTAAWVISDFPSGARAATLGPVTAQSTSLAPLTFRTIQAPQNGNVWVEFDVAGWATSGGGSAGNIVITQ